MRHLLMMILSTISGVRIAKPCEDKSLLMAAFSSQVHEHLADTKETDPTRYDRFIVHPDNFDSHLKDRLPLRQVVTLFIRAGTNRLGGPESQQRLHEEGLVFVVSKVENCFLFDDGLPCYPGEEVTVESTINVKRVGMIIEFLQTLKTGTGVKLAQRKTTYMTLDAACYRPTSKLPSWFQRKGFETSL